MNWMRDYTKENVGAIDKPYLSKRVQLIPASHIPIRPILWLWPGWLASGKLHILAGAAGTGKTNIALFMAATISKGGCGGKRWPDNSFAPDGHVIIWTGEDSVEETIIPRLKALGADLERVHILKGTVESGRTVRPFDFTKDIELLSIEMARLGDVKLVIIDSIVQAVAGDSNKNSEVRKALEPLVERAEKHNCAIVGITHLAKGSKTKDPLDRVAGSMAFGAVARVVMVTAKVKSEYSSDEPPRCVIVRAKSNIGLDVGGFEYSIASADLQEESGIRISTAMISFGSAIEGTARDILKNAENGDEGGKASKVDAASDFLLEMLSNGSVAQAEVEARAVHCGISMAAIKRAKKSLGILSRKQCGVGQASPSIWTLADHPKPNSVWQTYSNQSPYPPNQGPTAPAWSPETTPRFSGWSHEPLEPLEPVEPHEASPSSLLNDVILRNCVEKCHVRFRNYVDSAGWDDNEIEDAVTKIIGDVVNEDLYGRGDSEDYRNALENISWWTNDYAPV